MVLIFSDNKYQLVPSQYTGLRIKGKFPNHAPIISKNTTKLSCQNGKHQTEKSIAIWTHSATESEREYMN